jgi:DNA-binding FadR family transcriptional regulator
MTRFAITPVRKRKLYEEIVERIEALILDGSLALGEQLPSEREFMTTFQVGRTAVREALFALNRMGLISIQNGERAIVTRPSASALLDELSPSIRHLLQAPGGVQNFQNAREMLEVALVRHAAANATANDLAQLAAALERNKSALGDTNAFIETDVGFHYVLAEISRNPIFTYLHAAMANWLKEQRETALHPPSSRERAFRAHARICRAVMQHDANGAERGMRLHLKEVSRFYWQANAQRP